MGAIASFFTLLHKHPFRKVILELVPQGDDPYDLQCARLRKKIDVIAEQSTELDTAGWRAQLEQLEGALHQRWELIHCDPQLSHFHAVEGDFERLAVTDFTDALLHDPAVDLADFLADAGRDLPEDGVLAGQIKQLLLQHYETDDPDIAAKVDFGMLASTVRWAHIKLRAHSKASARRQA